MEWVYKALNEYGLQDMNVQALNKDGDVYVVITPSGKKRFLKILYSNGGCDYLNDENIYHSWPQICCEMAILAELEKTSLGTAHPIKNIHNEYVSSLGVYNGSEVYATLTTFV